MQTTRAASSAPSASSEAASASSASSSAAPSATSASVPTDEQRHVPFSQLDLISDYLFREVVSNEEIGPEFCRILLSVLLGRPLRKVYVSEQKIMSGADTDRHGIRLDAYVQETGDTSVEIKNVYDIEPDTRYRKDSLPKRSRYYQGLIDSRFLMGGEGYEGLPNLYIIFILPYDPFGHKRMLYTVTAQCKEDRSVRFDDGAVKMFFYTNGNPSDCGSNVRDLLRYMKETKQENVTSREIDEIDRMVKRVKASKEANINYMKSWEIEKEMKEEGREEGRYMSLVGVIRALLSNGQQEKDISGLLHISDEEGRKIAGKIKEFPGGSDLEIAQALLSSEYPTDGSAG